MKPNRLFYLRITIVSLVIMVLFSCNHEPEFYIDGKPYYSISNCVDYHYEQKYDWHYGSNMMKGGKFEYHYGLHTISVCDKHQIDTIEIK